MKNRSIAMTAVFVALTLSNVACLKAKPERAKPKPGPDQGTTIAGGGAGSQLRAAIPPGQVQASCDGAVKKFTKTVEDIVKLETAKRTVEETVVAFESALSELNDTTLTLIVSGLLSKDAKEEGAKCKASKDGAISKAFSKKELYDAFHEAVTAKAPDGDEKRLAEVLMRAMEEKGATGSDLKAKHEELNKLHREFEENLKPVTTSLSAIAETEARKTEFMKRQTKGVAENAKILPQILKLRTEIATARKKKSWADFKASQGMPKDADTVARRLLDIQEILLKRLADQKAILAKYASEHTDLKVKELNPWDVDFLLEKYFAAESADANKAFDRDAVILGLLTSASTAFGFVSAEVKDEKPIAEGVKHLELSRDGKAFANFYFILNQNVVADAETAEAEDASSPEKLHIITLSTAHTAGKATGAAALVTGNLPATLRYAEVATLARDLGKLLQRLLYSGKYASLSSRALSADYREIGPKTLENWASEPSILASVAKISSEQAEKLAKARAFTMTYRLASYLYAARVDVYLNGEGSTGDLPTLAERIYSEVYGVKLDQPPTAIQGLNGSAWIKVWREAYSADLYTAFAGKPTDPAVGKRFGEMLAKGATVEPESAMHDFLQRDASLTHGLEVLLKK